MLITGITRVLLLERRRRLIRLLNATNKLSSWYGIIDFIFIELSSLPINL